MKKQLLILGLFFLLALPSFGQILWQNTYGLANGLEQSNKMIPLSSGGYLITGYQYVTGRTTSPVYTVKTNSVGDTIWTKGHYPPAFLGAQATDACEDADGNYLLVGYGATANQAVTDNQGFLIKLNTNGDTIWTHRIMTPYFDGFNNVVLSNDSGYVVTGKNNGQSFLFKYNPDGSLRWKKPHQFSATDTGYFIGLHKMTTGYLLFTKAHYMTGLTKVIRVDENGNELYHKFNKHWDGGLARIADDPAGNLLFALGDKLVKLNSQGDTLWSRRYMIGARLAGIESAKPTDDGNYILYAATHNGMDPDIGLIKVTPNGDVIKDTILYRFGYHEWAKDISVDANGNYVMAGYTHYNNVGVGDQQIFMVALKKWAKTTVGLKEDLPEKAIQLYPNPTTNQLLISGDKPLSGSLTIYNLQRQKLWQQELDQVSEQQISLQTFAKGIYLLQYQDSDGNQISKRVMKL